MSTSILDLPTEVLDHIFDYLPFIDRQRARLVCLRWNQLLSAPRYMKATQLRLTPYFHRQWSADDLLRFASQGKLHCMVLDATGDNFSQECLAAIVQLLEAGCFCLEKIQLEYWTDRILRAVFAALGKMRRMRHLIIGFRRGESTELPKFPGTGPEPIGFSFVTNMDLCLSNASCLQLVNSLASQLTCVTLHVRVKELLEQFLNELHLPALHSLTVHDSTQNNQGTIEPGALGGGCWRILAQLETLRLRDVFLFGAVLTEMISHCQNLKHLTLDHCLISMQCMKQIGAFKGLKELNLKPDNNLGFMRREGEPLLHLPNLEHLSLSIEANIKFGKLPKLTSVTINGGGETTNPKAILSEIKTIDGIGGRRLRKLHITDVTLDWEANDWIRTFWVDLVSFSDCDIDGTLFDVLANAGTQRKIARIRFMDDCTFTFQSEEYYRIRTVAELRRKCPYLQITEKQAELFFCRNRSGKIQYYSLG